MKVWNLKLAAVAAFCMMLASCGSDADRGPDVVTASSFVQVRAQVNDSSAITIAGYRNNYAIASNNGQVTVTNKYDAADVRSYTGVKLIRFVDRNLSFDIDGPAGQMYRLYQATFNRKPDPAGLGFWITANENGQALLDIAGSFIDSGEFKTLYGDKVSAATFIDKMYQNILQRAGEPAGVNWWVEQVNGGADRRSVLLGFADGPENKTKLLPDMINGFEYVPYGTKTIPVKQSSYENKVAAAQVVGAQWLPPEVAGGNAVAFADFFQDGSYSMVTHTLEYIPEWSQTKFGHIKFYKRAANGSWVDNTAALLKDTQGCLHPRKAVVADFNGDGKPDVFFACHGFDRDPFPGEQPHILLSQADGTYQNKTLPVTCFCHSATAVDYRNDGYADIIVTDNMVQGTPFFLTNNRDGTFKVDTARLPSELKYKRIFSIEAIDFDQRGFYDVWIGGNEPGATAGATTTEYDTAPRILKNDGKGNYPSSLIRDLPIVPDYGLPLDIVVNQGKLYLLRTNIGGGPTNYGLSFYTTAAVQVIDYKTGASTVPYVHSGPYANGMPWVNWLIPVKDKVLSMDAAYGITLP